MQRIIVTTHFTLEGVMQSPGLPMSPTIAAFERSPDRGRGRALEEVDLLPDDANARARAIDLSHAKKGTRA